MPVGAQALTVAIPGQTDGSVAATRYAACGGRDISPAVTFGDSPPGTKTLALTIFDPDAQDGAGYVHWVLYNLPPTVKGLPEGAGRLIPAGGTGGANSRGNGLYFGMCPPVGDPPHRYIFHLYATDLPAYALPPHLSEPALRAAIAGHILADASVTLRYQRR